VLCHTCVLLAQGSSIIARKGKSCSSGIRSGFFLPTASTTHSSRNSNKGSRAGQQLLQLENSTPRVTASNTNQAVQQPAAVPPAKLASSSTTAAGTGPRLGRAWLDAARAGDLLRNAGTASASPTAAALLWTGDQLWYAAISGSMQEEQSPRRIWASVTWLPLSALRDGDGCHDIVCAHKDA